MRLLCIDHFFKQDIEGMALSGGEHRCWSVPFQRFHDKALEVLPPDVAHGVAAYYKPEYEEQRRRYAEIAAREVDRLYKIYRFDAVLAPSDVFFWIRPVVERCQQLGVPFAVLQKEATVAPGYLERMARELGEVSPFIADHMLVSSEHHKQFWVNAGVDPGLITVTGQPRFDIYERPEQRRGWAEMGVELDLPGRPTVLFLTYDSSAYLPMLVRDGLEPWLELREGTERVLLDLAEEGKANVLFKMHPLPEEDQRPRLAELGRNHGVTILDHLGDVRHYIAKADVVVGFQTTALFEALAAGAPTINTFWGEAAHRYQDDLTPFHKQRDALVVAESPEELKQAIVAALESGQRGRTPAAERFFEQFLGPVDGRAGERCWAELERLTASGVPSSERRRLDERRRLSRLPTAVGAAGAAVLWTLASGLAPLMYPLYRLAARLLGRGEPLERGTFKRELDWRRVGAAQRLSASTSG